MIFLVQDGFEWWEARALQVEMGEEFSIRLVRPTAPTVLTEEEEEEREEEQLGKYFLSLYICFEELK